MRGHQRTRTFGGSWAGRYDPCLTTAAASPSTEDQPSARLFPKTQLIALAQILAQSFGLSRLPPRKPAPVSDRLPNLALATAPREGDTQMSARLEIVVQRANMKGVFDEP